MGHLRIFFAILLGLSLAGILGAETFPEPKKDTNVWDYGKCLSKTKEGHLQISCDSYKEKHGSQVWVVTVSNLSKYGANANEIEGYAEWFLAEKLVELGADDNSILILLSTDDRKARIELGRAWGHGWDRECEHIMQSKGVPNFRKKKYGKGLGDMVRALNVMTTHKEQTSPAVVTLSSWGATIAPYSGVPPVAVIPSLLLSFGLLIVGLKAKANGQYAIIIWPALILGGITFFGGGLVHFFTDGYAEALFKGIGIILLIIFFIWLDFNTRGSRGWGYSSWDSGSGWGSSGWDSGSSWGGGGGLDFGGGFDFGGGGGATGSW